MFTQNEEKENPKEKALRRYARNQFKIPTESLSQQFNQSSKQYTLTDVEKEFIRGRKAWSDIVSNMENINDLLNQHNKIKNQVLERFKKLNVNYDNEILYQKCIDCLKYDSVLVYTFKAEFLRNGLTDYQPLNIYQKPDNKSVQYKNYRLLTEKGLFKSVNSQLLKIFNDNIHARPRYAALFLVDPDHPISAIPLYGKSYAILAERIKFNSLYNPGDSVNDNYYHKREITPCTYHHFELLLLQCHEIMLKAIIEKARTGFLPKNYNQMLADDPALGGYIEVMIPSIDMLDPDLVQLHIDESEYNLSLSDVETLNKIGMTFTNSVNNPQEMIAKEFIDCVKNNAIARVRELLKIYPSLAKSIDISGKSVLHFACEKNYAEIIKLLLDTHINPNQLSIDGYTPLHLAIQNESLQAISILLQSSAIDTSIKAKATYQNGMTPLFFTFYHKKNPQVLQLLSMQGVNIKAELNDLIKYAMSHSLASYLGILLEQHFYNISNRTTEDSLLFSLCKTFCNALQNYSTKDPERLRSINLIFHLAFKLLDETRPNKTEIMLGCFFYQAENAQNLHLSQWFKWKNKSLFATLVDQVIDSFKLTQPLSFSKNYYFEKYAAYMNLSHHNQILNNNRC